MRTEFNTDQGIIVNSTQELNVLCNFLDEQGYKWFESKDFKMETLNLAKGVFFEGFPLAIFPADGKWIPNLNEAGAEDYTYIEALDAIGIKPMNAGDDIEGRSFDCEEWKDYKYLGFDKEKEKPFRVLKSFLCPTVGRRVYNTVYVSQIRRAVNCDITLLKNDVTEQRFNDLVEIYSPKK